MLLKLPNQAFELSWIADGVAHDDCGVADDFEGQDRITAGREEVRLVGLKSKVRQCRVCKASQQVANLYPFEARGPFSVDDGLEHHRDSECNYEQ